MSDKTHAYVHIINSMKQWLKDWAFEICWFGGFVLLIGFFLCSVVCQTYEENSRIYTMVVDVYYTDTPERHTFVSDGVPIRYICNRGVSRVAGKKEYVRTTAPIKVISNTYREKK